MCACVCVRERESESECVCVCVCVCVCERLVLLQLCYSHTSMHAYTHSCTRIRAYTDQHTSICTHLHVCTRPCMHTHTHKRTHPYRHTYTHPRMHTHISTCILTMFGVDTSIVFLKRWLPLDGNNFGCKELMDCAVATTTILLPWLISSLRASRVTMCLQPQ